MPILPLQRNRAPQFPCIGKLRKGGAKRRNAQGKEIMGVDLNYFRFTTDDAHAAETFAAYYGAQPQSIDVLLPYATTAENFGAWLEEYTAGGMARRCDGETQHFHRDADGKGNTTPVKCERLCGRKCGCKEVGRLAVIVPQLARLASVTVETHSLYDIMQLTENLQAAEALRGDLRGIPFILSRRDREISTPGEGGKRTRRTKSLLFIEPNPEWVARQLESMRLAALPIVDVPALQAPAMRRITGPVTVDADDFDDEEEDDGDEMDTATPPRKEAPPQSTPPAVTVTTTGNGGGAGNGRKTNGNGAPGAFGNVQTTRWPDANAAYAWAIEAGACENTHEARGSLKKIVDAQFGGRLTGDNMAAAFDAFHARQMEKLHEKAEAAVKDAPETTAAEIPA